MAYSDSKELKIIQESSSVVLNETLQEIGFKGGKGKPFNEPIII